jgi:hypothetical protein
MEKNNGDGDGDGEAAPAGITNGGTAAASGGRAATHEVTPTEDGPISKSFEALSTDHNSDANGNHHAKVGEDKSESYDSSGTTNGHGGPTTAPAGASSAEADADADGTELMRVDEEGADEEEALFAELEKQEEEEGKAFEQPKDYHAAPKLLQKDLETGAVKADDSEEESDREHVAVPADGSNVAATALAATTAEEPPPAAAVVSSHHHIHGRVRFVRCVLPRSSSATTGRAWTSPRLKLILFLMFRPLLPRDRHDRRPALQTNSCHNNSNSSSTCS